MSAFVPAAKPRACGVCVFVRTVSVFWCAGGGGGGSDDPCAVLGRADLIDHRNHNLFETFMMNTIPINL